MLKKFFCLALSFLIATSANAQVVIGNASIGNMTVKSGIHNNTALVREMLKYPGLTFVKDYSTGTIDADFSAGSPTGTFTSTRSATAPATYIDANGVIQVSTTSDVPLFDGGYYDATGFHQKPMGYHAYRASTNLLTRTDGTAYGAVSRGIEWTGWSCDSNKSISGSVTSSVNSIPGLSSISGATSQRIQYVGASDIDGVIHIYSPASAVGSVSTNDTITLSMYIKTSGSPSGVEVQLRIYANDASGGDLTSYTSSKVTITSAWRKYTFTATITDATVSRARGDLRVSEIDTGDVVDYEIALPQLEKLPYATPFIPTTTAALTRAGDVLKYENAGNSTANEETIIVQFTPGSAFANDGITRNLYGADNLTRYIWKANTATSLKFDANYTESILKLATATTVPLANTSYVVAVVAKHSSPYLIIYMNGSSEGTYTTSDWTNPVFGTYFNIGTSTASPNFIDGNIRRVIKFNRALSVDENLAIAQYLAAN